MTAGLSGLADLLGVCFLFALLRRAHGGPVLSEDVVGTRRSLHTNLASTHVDPAVLGNLRDLVETNEPCPRLTQLTVIVGTDTVPHVTKVALALEGRRRLEVPCDIDLVERDRKVDDVVGRAEELSARCADVSDDSVAAEFPIVGFRCRSG